MHASVCSTLQLGRYSNTGNSHRSPQQPKFRLNHRRLQVVVYNEATNRQVISPLVTRRALLSTPALMIAPAVLAAEPSPRGFLAGLTGPPVDLYFPPMFEGTWDVYTSLFDVQVPFGEDRLGGYRGAYDRAGQEIGKVVKSQRRYTRNASGRVVNDRKFSYASLAAVYLGNEQCDQEGDDPISCLERRIEWDLNNPDIMTVNYKSGTTMKLYTVLRSQDTEAENKFSTSEFYKETFEKRSSSPGEYNAKLDLTQQSAAELRAAQKFTKYKSRSAQAAAADGGPVIVGTQVVSYYANVSDSDSMLAGDAATLGRPVLQLSSKLAFVRPS